MLFTFYGDSFISGDNNNGLGYADYLKELIPDHSVHVYGTEGTTFGNYSIYPIVDGDLITKVYQTKQSILLSDHVFLCYGIDDSAAIAARYVPPVQVMITMVKCEKLIKSINPNCTIHFVAFNNTINKLMIEGQVKFLNEEYFTGIPKNMYSGIGYDHFFKTYESLVITAKSVFNDMILIDSDEFNRSHMDEDLLHPNESGYRLIAETLRNQLQSKQII